ncbi:MAG: PDZ domain-containing protein [Clostridium perfringens]|nr:PDZ domain-containing protein [Clostridium perfringens]
MDLVLATIRSISYAIINPALAVLLLIIALLFYIRNRKINFLQSMVLGERLNSPLELTISQVVIGIIAGTVTSLVLTSLGITFYEDSGIEFLFIISIIVMLYKPRIFSFPYVAAILGILSVVIPYNSIGQVIQIKVDVPNIIILVGVISVIEGILIIIDGRKGYIPVFTNRNGEILGGFIFKRCWSLPIAFFIVLNSINGLSLNNLSISNIYLLIAEKDLVPITTVAILAILPFYSIIGFEAVTFTKNKIRKTISSGFVMIIYGTILFFLSLLSTYGVSLKILSIILMPSIYIIIKYIEKYIEKKSKPLFVSNEEGICILDVVPKSIAFKEGVRGGDKIIAIDGLKPFNEVQILKAIRNKYINTTLKIKNIKGEIKDYVISGESKESRFGIVLVPINIRKRYNIDKIIGTSEFKKNV